jgi:pimeloyl-ACP methyl ester carboxylesterase
MLVNPGGPGFGGSSVAADAEYYFSDELLDRFDIIGWDPRGTGKSTPAVDCVDEYDDYFGIDSTPESPEEKQAIIDAGQSFNDKCETNSGEILPYISTQATARDMDSIRRALGEEKITYFGFSYGSELGATWATMFPETVRAAVLDGASDPNATSLDQGLAQAQGFEKQLDAFLSKCSKRVACVFNSNGNSAAALDKLITDIDAKPLVVSADRTPVTQGVMYTALAQAMYSDALWPQLERSLSDAVEGDGAGLLQLYDDYFQRKPDGSYGNELEAFLAISCLDDPGPTSVEEVDAQIPVFTKAAKRFGASFAYGYSCALWPVAQAPRITITGRGAGPIIVIGTTGDPATPIESSRKAARSLEGGLFLTVKADQHTGYGLNTCVVETVDRYLIDLKAPADGKVCG